MAWVYLPTEFFILSGLGIPCYMSLVYHTTWYTILYDQSNPSPMVFYYTWPRYFNLHGIPYSLIYHSIGPWDDMLQGIPNCRVFHTPVHVHAGQPGFDIQNLHSHQASGYTHIRGLGIMFTIWYTISWLSYNIPTGIAFTLALGYPSTRYNTLLGMAIPHSTVAIPLGLSPHVLWILAWLLGYEWTTRSPSVDCHYTFLEDCIRYAQYWNKN